MLDATSTALSGMQAAWQGLQVAGQNIANLGTAGYRRQQLAATAGAEGGVATTVTAAAAPGAAPEADMVGLLQATNSFLASLAVFKTSDRMAGALLDIAG